MTFHEHAATVSNGLHSSPGGGLNTKRDKATVALAAMVAEYERLREASRLNQQGFPHGISWRPTSDGDGNPVGGWSLNLHRDGWDIEVEVSGNGCVSFSCEPAATLKEET